MRTLKYALLGLINRSPITGYDITKEFDSRALANFWYAKHSQVYPELKRLLDESLVEYKVVIQGEVMEKKLYSITEKGRLELEEWLLMDEPLGLTPKDIFRLRAYFSDFMPKEGLISSLESQIQKHTQKLEYLQAIMDESHSCVPEFGTSKFGDYIVLEGAIMRERTYIEWLKKSLGYVLDTTKIKCEY